MKNIKQMNVRNRPRTCKTDSIHPWSDQPILIHNLDCLYVTLFYNGALFGEKLRRCICNRQRRL